MHEKHIENLLNMSAQERVDYFVRRCAEVGVVWGLVVGEDNWVIFKGPDGEEVFPLWPHEALAERCMFEEHRKMGAAPQAIAMASFLNRCIPDMAEQNVAFGVFFDLGQQALTLPADTLKGLLQSEIALLSD